MVENLIPENDLEDLLVKTQENKIDFEEFISFFLKADIYVPSGSEVMPDGTGLTPLLFEKNEVQMAGVFTALSRSNLFKDKTPYCLSMKGREFLTRIPPEFGLVVNPGFNKGFDLPPLGIKKIQDSA